jgi:fumarate reductase flavoprotein subunit
MLVACNQENNGKEELNGAVDGQKMFSYNSGKYIGKAMGHNGTIEVEVEFSEDAITAINILDNEETTTVAKTAFDQLPQKIIDEQSIGVDSISGATISSVAIKNAVLNAAEQANGNTELLKKSIEKEPKTETIELEADVIVVGGGGAGMTAAMGAEQKGLSVILLEKNAMLGGHTAFSGAFSLITGSKLQSEKYGITNDSVEAVYDDNFKNGGGVNIPEDLQLYSENMGPATDWIDDYIGAPTPNELTPLSENSINRAMIYEDAGDGLKNALAAKLEETDVGVHVNVKATSLLLDGDKVIGVEAEGSDGTKYQVKGAATVLATGSYGARKDLLPETLNNFVYYGAQLAQGEGMEMAQEIGADVVNQGYVELFENGVEWQPGIAKSTYNGSMAAWDVSGILVDRSGKRVVNERTAGINIVKEMAKQEDGRLFLLMDQATYDSFESNITGYGISQELLDRWLENNAKDPPYFAHADTIEEVAEILDIDTINLQKTVDRYNEFVKKGIDEDFGRDADYLTEPIGEGPYYLVEQKPRYATTLGGLKINKDLQVINTDGKSIEGLFAAGDVAGGARGNDSIPGADVGWALTSGYAVGQVLAEKLGGN